MKKLNMLNKGFSRTTARQFLPAHLELLETPPSPTLRRTAYSICGIVVTVLLWSYISKVEIISTAAGRLVLIGNNKHVQPFETSVIKRIYVAEGDFVEEGQDLIDLDPTDAAADLEAARLEWSQALLQAQTSKALLNGRNRLNRDDLKGADELLLTSFETKLKYKMEEYQSAQNAILEQITNKKASLAIKEIEKERNTLLLPLAQERYETQYDLFKKGNTSKMTLLQAQYDLIDKKSDKDTIPIQSAQINADLAAEYQKLAQLRAQFLNEASEQYLVAMNKASAASQILKKGLEREKLKHLRAPVAGTVHDLKIHTHGGVVTTADVLLSIVPKDANLEVEANMPHREIGFVTEGQLVSIKLDAFPFIRYGTIGGIVRLVGRSATDLSSQQMTNSMERKMQQSQPSSENGYKIRIKVDQTAIATENGNVPLKAGMEVSADIVTGKRRLLDFVLDPVRKHISEAARER